MPQDSKLLTEYHNELKRLSHPNMVGRGKSNILGPVRLNDKWNDKGHFWHFGQGTAETGAVIDISGNGANFIDSGGVSNSTRQQDERHWNAGNCWSYSEGQYVDSAGLAGFTAGIYVRFITNTNYNNHPVFGNAYTYQEPNDLGWDISCNMDNDYWLGRVNTDATSSVCRHYWDVINEYHYLVLSYNVKTAETIFAWDGRTKVNTQSTGNYTPVTDSVEKHRVRWNRWNNNGGGDLGINMGVRHSFFLQKFMPNAAEISLDPNYFLEPDI